MKRSQPLGGALAALALACVGSIAGSVAAQPAEREPTRFEFRSAAGCGSAQEFVAKVQRRSARIRLRGDAAGGRALVVDIQAPDAAGTFAGKVTVIEPDGATRARSLDAKTCEEAMEGLSLIATVTLDPEALLAEPLEEEASPTAPAPKAPPPPRPQTPTSRPPPPERRAQYRVSIGLEAAALFRVSPEPAFGGAISAAFELERGGALSPLWRLSLLHAQRRGVGAAAGDANFAFTLPTLDVCPVRLGPAAFNARPCAYASFGLLEVWGSDTVAEEQHSRPAGSSGATLLLGWRLSETFEIIADGRAGLAFWRDRFAFDDVGFFRTESLVFSVGAGLAGGFP